MFNDLKDSDAASVNPSNHTHVEQEGIKEAQSSDGEDFLGPTPDYLFPSPTPDATHEDKEEEKESTPREAPSTARGNFDFNFAIFLERACQGWHCSTQN